MIQQEISATDREQFFGTFSRLHDGAFITLRVNAREEAVRKPFHGVSWEDGGLVVHAGSDSYRVFHVAKVRLEQTDEGADVAIAITSDDGTRTEVRFQSPVRADLLDPAVE